MHRTLAGSLSSLGMEKNIKSRRVGRKQTMIGWGSHWSRQHIKFTVASNQQFSAEAHPEEGWTEKTSWAALSGTTTSVSGEDGLGRRLDKHVDGSQL